MILYPFTTNNIHDIISMTCGIVNLFDRAIFTLDAIGLIFVLYFVKCTSINPFYQNEDNEFFNSICNIASEIYNIASETFGIPNLVSLIVIDIVMVVGYILISLLLLKLVYHFQKDETSGIISIEPVNGTYLPIYLGYIFVALSIPNDLVLILVVVLLFVFLFISGTFYFNPMFLFKYNYYSVIDKRNVKLLILMDKKKNVKAAADIYSLHLRRITNHTFIEFGKDVECNEESE